MNIEEMRENLNDIMDALNAFATAKKAYLLSSDKNSTNVNKCLQSIQVLTKTIYLIAAAESDYD